MNATRNDIKPKARKAVCGILNQLLADLFDLYSQANQAHWTVRGRAFFQLHKLFDELAETVEGQLDPLAERISQLGGTPKGTVRQSAGASSLPEFPADPGDDFAFVEALIARFAAAANAVRKAIDTTDGEGDAVSADLLTGMAAELDKALWFLEAHNRG